MVTFKKEIYEVRPGEYGYKIFIDGKLVIVQPHKPRVQGFVPMSKDEANELAEKTISDIKTAMEIAERTRVIDPIVDAILDDLFEELITPSRLSKVKLKFEKELKEYKITDEEIKARIKEWMRMRRP